MYPEIDKPLNVNEILDDVHDLRIGGNLRYYTTAGSTNDIAYRLAEKGENEGVVVIADEQTAGKGRLNRNWASPRFKGIYASVLLRPEVDVLFASRFTMLASISAARAIREMTGISAQIKWPNDIVIGEKKTAGVLAEIKLKEKIIHFIIIGIGINVNQLDGDFPKDIAAIATSLLIEGGKSVSREKLTAKVLSSLDEMYPKALLTDFSPIADEWKRLSPYHENCSVIIRNGDTSRRGITRGLTENGELIVEVRPGENIIVSYGDLMRVERDPYASRH